jgi:hypothetical protein
MKRFWEFWQEVQEAIFDPDTKQTYRHKDRVKRLESIYQKYGNNAYISFTKMNKLGVNPVISPTKTTPVGIFAYPLSYLMVTLKGDIEGIPYARHERFIQVFSIKPGARVIQFDRIQGSTISTIAQKVAHPGMFKKWFGKPTPEAEIDAALKGMLLYPQLKSYAKANGLPWQPMHAIANSLVNSNGTLLWNVTKEWAKGNYSRWNKILRDLGVDAIVDNDTSTIHMIEPTQMVVLNPTIIQPIDVIPNHEEFDPKYYSKEPDDRREPVKADDLMFF